MPNETTLDIEATHVEEGEQHGQSTALQVANKQQGLMPALTVEAAVMRFRQLVSFVTQVLVDGIDYGLIPGTGTKKTLLKPGAEKIAAFFGLSPDFKILTSIEDWSGKQYGEPLFYYHYQCLLMRDGTVIGAGDGSCNSWETKYRYREGKRLCPVCSKPAIIRGKEEYGGGWLCFRKKDGCGTKFDEKDSRITGQNIDRVPNPDIFDQVNTIQKMGAKRALVAAVLMIGAVSELFTQDLEDFQPGLHAAREQQLPPAQPPQQRPAPAPPQKRKLPTDAIAKHQNEFILPGQIKAINAKAQAFSIDAEAECLRVLRCNISELSQSAAAIFIDYLGDRDAFDVPREQGGSGVEPVTDKQLAAIYAIAQAGSRDAQIESMTLHRREPEQLTRSEASDLIDHLKKLAESGEPQTATMMLHNRAKTIAAMGMVERDLDGFNIASPGIRRETFRVWRDGENRVVCNCADFDEHRNDERPFRCEHILAVKFFLEPPAQQD